MKKQVIIITFNGEPSLQFNSFSKSTEFYVGQDYQHNPFSIEQKMKSFSTTSNYICENKFIGGVGIDKTRQEEQNNNVKKQITKKTPKFQNNQQKYKKQSAKQKQPTKKSKTKKKINKKYKTNFQIKNVLQQICSSIQTCLKSSFIPQLTHQFWEHKLPSSNTYSHKQTINKLNFYLQNPSEHNIGCLLRMGGQVNKGLQKIFKTRILKKYIQCSKIRTLKQKIICLQAVDYLFKCFQQQQLLSLHTWAHQRQNKIYQQTTKFKSMSLSQ